MLPATQKRVQKRRDEKAKMMRGLREIKALSNSRIRVLAAMQWGESERVQPEVLADYWPIRKHGDVLYVSSGDSESWRTVYLCPGHWDDYDIEHCLGVGEWYSGPGRGFSRVPWVQKNGFSTLVYWSGGLDI